MATSAAIATGLLPDTISSTVDLTVSGFGSPDAAILFFSNANSTNNPQATASVGVGFWDGTNQVSAGAYAEDGEATTVTGRGLHTTNGVALPANNAGTEVWAIRCSVSGITDGVRLTVTEDNTGVQRYVTAILLGGLTNVSAASYQLGTATTPVDITDPGFKPDLVYFATNGGNATGLAANGLLSVGAAHNNSSDTVTQGMACLYSVDGQSAATVSGCYADNAYCCGQVFNDTVTWKMAASAFDANGFTVTPTANPGSDYFIYLAIELADPDDAYVGLVDSATSTGTKAYTGTGFSPDVVNLFATMASANQTVTQNGSLAIGAMDSTTERCVDWRDSDGVGTSDSDSNADLSNVLKLRDDGGTNEDVAAFSSFDSDGWTLNYSTASATARKMLAVAIGDSAGAAGTITGSGALTEVAGTVAGIAERVITGSGTPSEPAGSIAGTGTVGGVVTGSGALSEVAGGIAGAGSRIVTGSGAPSEPVGTIAGAGARIITGSGTVVEVSADIVGAAVREITGSGAVSEPSGTVTGREVPSNIGAGGKGPRMMKNLGGGMNG